MSAKNSRLQFTDAEREDSRLKEHIRRADKAADNTKGSPQSRPSALWGEEEQGSERSFPRKRETKLSGLCDDDAAQAKVPKKKKLVKRQEADPATGKPKTRLRFEDVDKPAPASKLSHAVKSVPFNAVSVQAHRKIQEAEQENVGVESAHRLEEAAEGGARLAVHSRRAQKLKPYRQAEKAQMRMGKANVNALYQKHI